MKHVSVLNICFLALTTSAMLMGCDASAPDLDRIQPAATVAPRSRLLEIRMDTKGVIKVVGETLFFRFSDDGTAEFEFADNGKKTKPVNRAEDVNYSVAAALNEKDKGNLTALLRSFNNIRLEQSYRRKCCCTDTQADFRVEIETDHGRKVTFLNGFCSASDLPSATKTIPEPPSEILRLFETTESLRWKYKKLIH